MILRTKLFFLWLLFICLCSCEYQLDKGNYRDIARPSETHQVDLRLLSEKDTIKIFGNTKLYCDFDLHGLTEMSGMFSMQGQKWYVSSRTALFDIFPSGLLPGYDTLSLVLYAKSGSGSMADIVGAEGYVAGRKWFVLVDGRPAPSLNLTKSITPEGYLKLGWPECNQYNIEYYDFQFRANSGGPKIKIYDPGTKYMIDTCYIGGGIIYVVNSKVQFNNTIGKGVQLTINDPYPTLNFEEKGFDSCRVYWQKSKYKATYKLFRDDVSHETAILESHTDTSVICPHLGVGNSIPFVLRTLPFHPQSSNTYYNQIDNKNILIGKYLKGNWPKMAYNRLEKMIYTNTGNELFPYDISSLSPRNRYYINYLSSQGLYSCPTNSSKIAALAGDNIYIFQNYLLQNPIIIPFDCIGQSITHFYLTDNDLISIVKGNVFEQIRLSDQKVIASVLISDFPDADPWACFTTSRDGKYFCFVSRKGIRLCSIVNGVLTCTYFDDRSYRSALFDDNTDDRLLLTFNDSNTIEVRNASDFSLVNQFSLPGKAEVLCDIDPESGYLLTTDYMNSYIIDVANSKLKLNGGKTVSRPNLFGNKFFSGNGYWLDISKYLH